MLVHLTAAVSKILFERYGIKIEVPDYLSLTGESEQRFQEFHPSELVSIPPSPLTPSVTKIPFTEGGHIIPVGWN